MKKFWLTVVIPALAVLFLTGCGGSNGSNSATEQTRSSGTGYYVDEAVAGISYRCGNNSGVTDSDGSFRFEKGSACSFYLGGILLRTIPADKLENGVVFVETDPAVAALLQSLDSDPDGGKIRIDARVADALKAKGIEKIPENDDEIASLVQSLKEEYGIEGIRPVTREEAKEHVAETLAKEAEKSPQKVVTSEETKKSGGSDRFAFVQLDDNAFNRLSEEQRIYVAKKLYNTLYKARDIATIKKEIASGHFISDFRNKLHATGVAQPDLDKIYQDTYEIPYNARAGNSLFEKRWRIFAHIASTLYYTRLSESYFNEWIAYVLDQTIMFSPAYEVDSVVKFPELIASNYERLEKALADKKTIRQIVYEHMVSKENWARFRSPEDNGREMLEIWLYDYDDSHVPLAAKALRNWRWEVRREKENGKGDYGDIFRFYNDTNNPAEINSETVEIFNKGITTGTDFYKMVAGSPRLVPTVVDRLVGLFFPTFSSDEKKKAAAAILASNPKTFQDIFEQILFSDKFLLESDRLKSGEELYFGLAHLLDMKPSGTTFRNLLTACLIPSSQAPFTYKLGRLDEGVSDTDSVIRLHQYIRSNVFLNRKGDGWNPADLKKRYPGKDLKSYLNEMFEDIVGRKMTGDETETLTEIVKEAGIDTEQMSEWDKFAVMLLAFDYFSRQSEIYTYTKVTRGDAS
ncbi:hypothetical protein [Hydrogenimonas sp. SS33]|uniref:hypothetical protein n=1 Tax=Hydrogenimonas leucolamina TaxID=2954236 RepID=UPI00336C2911